MRDVTRILSAIEEGKAYAADELLPLVYDELRKLAAHKMAQEPPGHTLQATALVHDAYLRLVDTETVRDWESRWQFFAAAAEAMRRILIERARRRHRLKRGGGRARQPLSSVEPAAEPDDGNLLALDEALAKLAEVEPPIAELVKLRFFAGLSVEDAARALGVSPRTAKRDWVFARAWLRREIDGDAPE